MTVKEVLDRTIQFFKDKKMDQPRLEAEWLIAGGLNVNRVQLYMKYEEPLKENEITRLREFVKRRASGEPLAYITGTKGFYKLDFKVTPDVLIPRPETETLVENAIEWVRKNLKGKSEIKILDIGSGSGCIGLTMAYELPNVKVQFIDVSEKALAIAKENAVNLELQEKCIFTLGDAAQVASTIESGFDLILSNPPYIAPNDPEVEQNVKKFEPSQALFAENGTNLLKSWAKLYAPKLSGPGLMMMEMGYKQGAEMQKYFENLEVFDVVQVVKDLSSLDRIIQGSIHG
jgi:release factor glutamine methyltransferase